MLACTSAPPSVSVTDSLLSPCSLSNRPLQAECLERPLTEQKRWISAVSRQSQWDERADPGVMSGSQFRGFLKCPLTRSVKSSPAKGPERVRLIFLVSDNISEQISQEIKLVIKKEDPSSLTRNSLYIPTSSVRVILFHRTQELLLYLQLCAVTWWLDRLLHKLDIIFLSYWRFYILW